MKLGILKTDAVRPKWVPEFGEYPDMFVALLGRNDPQLEFEVFDVEEGQFPEVVDAVDAYLITGSKSSVYEDKPWIARPRGPGRPASRERAVPRIGPNGFRWEVARPES